MEARLRRKVRVGDLLLEKQLIIESMEYIEGANCEERVYFAASAGVKWIQNNQRVGLCKVCKE